MPEFHRSNGLAGKSAIGFSSWKHHSSGSQKVNFLKQWSHWEGDCLETETGCDYK